MRVNDTPVPGLRIDQRMDVGLPAAVPPAIRPAPDGLDQSSTFEMTADLARLVVAANAVEDVRQGLVAEVSRRLADGAYRGREAAERTAEAILQSGV